MKITKENVDKLNILDNDKRLLNALLLDIAEFNNELDNQNLSNKKLYIDYQDYHNEYSPERTDPCPDYFGYYFLRFENNPNATCGVEMSLDELDNTICTLINLIEYV
jgi:hypothetical protein